MSEIEKTATGEVVVRLTASDVLDASLAAHVPEWVQSVSPGSGLLVDLSRVGSVDYHGLAALAAGLETAGVRARLGGLTEENVRLLRYMGRVPVTSRNG